MCLIIIDPIADLQAIGMLSFSGSLTLDGVELKLPVAWQLRSLVVEVGRAKWGARCYVDLFMITNPESLKMNESEWIPLKEKYSNVFQTWSLVWEMILVLGVHFFKCPSFGWFFFFNWSLADPKSHSWSCFQKFPVRPPGRAFCGPKNPCSTSKLGKWSNLTVAYIFQMGWFNQPPTRTKAFWESTISRWWFQRFLIFQPYLGKMSPIWRAYFSDGLVQFNHQPDIE